MKRSTGLLELSREHHSALKLALVAKKAANSAVEGVRVAAIAAVQAAMRSELEPHFQIEEDRLLPALAAAGCAELVARTLAEHQALRAAAAALVNAQAENLQAFAELLQAHVRFEERELFEVAQQRLAPTVLAGLGGG